MTQDEPMPHASTCPPRPEATDPHAKDARGGKAKSPMAAHILIQSALAAVASAVCLEAKWPIPGLASAILSFGLGTVWVNTAFSQSSRFGGAPRWLASLEKLRQYLANEGDEPRTPAPAQQ